VEVALENGKFYLIDVNEELISPHIVIETSEQINPDYNSDQQLNQDIFSMFNENLNVYNKENRDYGNSNSNDSLTFSPEKKPESSTIKKIPISFDVKITDETNIEELKAKLKEIKDFLDQEF